VQVNANSGGATRPLVYKNDEYVMLWPQGENSENLLPAPHYSYTIHSCCYWKNSLPVGNVF